jgi:hypothetical protein
MLTLAFAHVSLLPIFYRLHVLHIHWVGGAGPGSEFEWGQHNLYRALGDEATSARGEPGWLPFANLAGAIVLTLVVVGFAFGTLRMLSLVRRKLASAGPAALALRAGCLAGGVGVSLVTLLLILQNLMRGMHIILGAITVVVLVFPFVLAVKLAPKDVASPRKMAPCLAPRQRCFSRSGLPRSRPRTASSATPNRQC